MKLFEKNPNSDWAETRKIGRLKYAITHGTVFGLFVFIFNLALIFFYDSFKTEFLINDLMIFLLISLTMGTFGYYTLMWWIQEKLYQTEKKDRF
ncbi:hypothetical protein [Marivirga sp.]|uniref:hypothetical protein n=1 Tax=Marivirga sp. TaxID=2018662 RepID=UPI002D800490|nr:hypothetical protein [Marivirga sp.]HET8859313.1 hypothetical protein [Marivirga sp.]